jgi:hypothetical protein
MKDEIQALVKFFKLVTADELYAALSKDNPLSRKTFHRYLDNLEDQGAIIKVLPDENSLGIEGYIGGPNLSNEIKINGKDLLDCDIDRRNSVDIDCSTLVKRLSKNLEDAVETLLEKTNLVYDDPRKLEIDYFSLSLRYHELRGFFLNSFEINAFNDVKLQLDECRKLLDNLEI